jgi:anti-sigma factor RsiW
MMLKSGEVHLQEEELKFYALGCMSSSRNLIISSHIAKCHACADMLAQTTKYISQLAELSRLQAGDNEKRREPRIPAADPASMRMIYPTPADRVAITVVDVSSGGLKLCVPQFVAPGEVFQILLKGLIISAEVRHCLPVGDEFHVGVKIQDIFSSGGQ